MKMPDLATTDSAIKVIRWLVTPGQPIKRGEALLEVETDKATMEVESIASGTFKQPLAQVGDALLSGQPLAVIEIEGPPRPTSAEPTVGRPTSATAVPASEAAQTASPSEGPAKEGKIENPPAAPRAGGLFAKNRAAAKPTPPPA